MTRLSIICDVAGQIAKTVLYTPRVTCAAIAIPTDDADSVRSAIRPSLPKWGKCTRADAEEVVELLMHRAAGIAVHSWNRATPIWELFWDGCRRTCETITRQDGKPVSFAKPSTVARYVLMTKSMAVAMARSIGRGHRSYILDAKGLELIEQALIVDKEFSGPEVLDYLNRLWVGDKPLPKVASAGFRVTTRELVFANEQGEPLLYLADYMAGLVHCSLIEAPGRLAMPLSQSEAAKTLEPLFRSGKVFLEDSLFDLKAEELFGDLG